jgi:hypothetical protein
MHTPIVFVSISAVAQEYHFSTLDGHWGHTYETVHEVELFLQIGLTKLSIERLRMMIQALEHLARVFDKLNIFLKGKEVIILNIPHQEFGWDEDADSCGASQCHCQTLSSKPGDSLSKCFGFATRVKELHVLGPYVTDVLRSFRIGQQETMNIEALDLFPHLGGDVCSFRWKRMCTSFRAKDLVCVSLASN